VVAVNALLRAEPRHQPRSPFAQSSLSRLRLERARKVGLIESLQKEVDMLDLLIAVSLIRERVVTA